jgi:hypothetical protein
MISRELKDKMSKAATASEYKIYQREHEVRREMEGELNHWKSEAEVCIWSIEIFS